jgi:hypothetical protein
VHNNLDWGAGKQKFRHKKSHNLYSQSHISLSAWRKLWSRYGRKIEQNKFSSKKLKIQNLGVVLRIILKQILKKLTWNGFICPKINDSGGTVWTRNWSLTSIKGGKLLHCVISGFGREVDENCVLLGFMQRVVAISYRRFGTNCQSHLHGLRYSPEEGSSQILDYLRRYQFLRNSERMKAGEGFLMSSTVSHPDKIKVRWLEEGGLDFLA